VEKSTAKIEVILHPLDKWRLYSQFQNGKAVGGFIQYVRIFGLVGLLVLVIACINFVNLATARSERRAREVGLRKAIGSARMDLIVQFLIESLAIAFVAFLFSLLLVQMALPGFNRLAQTRIDLPYSSPVFWAVMTGYVLLTGLLAGIRPAFYFSSFQPVKILRGVMQAGTMASLSRKMLVVVQFACSFALITGTLIIYHQIKYGKDRPTGYDPSGLLEVDMTHDLQKNYKPLKNELLQDRLVESISTASNTPDGFSASLAVTGWPGQKAGESLEMPITGASMEYFRTVGMKMKAGREFNSNADSTNIILNEAAVKRLRLVDPLNSLITMEDSSKHLRVIGVVGDAVMLSPFQAAIPSIFTYNPNWANNILLRLPSSANIHESVARLTAVFNKYNPSSPMMLHFADENYAHKFDAETMLGTLAALFAGLAILISCLGLFGLSAYVAEQRNREIGIRKIVGASVWQIWRLLSTNFILLVGIGCLVAIPVAYYLLSGWLDQYDYRISIGPGVFLLATGIAILIAVGTVSFQVVRAARANPVKSLRRE
jgi:ABC-type antimicrobial peptide transport system permease subunit